MSGLITTELPVAEARDTADLEHGPEVQLSLVLLDTDHPGRAIAVRDHVVIGRAPSCELCIDRADVSRHHARISLDAARRVVLTDLGSCNGTFVNGRRITEHTLEPGDRVGLGTVMLLLTHSHHVDEVVLHHQRIEAMGRLAGGVVHDFNNLLGVIVGNVNVLQHLPASTGLGDPDVREILEDLRMAARRAGEVTEQLLSFSRRNPGEHTTVDVSTLVSEVLRLCRRTFDRHIELVGQVVPRVQVLGDRGQLHQVLMNLLLNARDAMPEGGRIVVDVGRAVERSGGPWARITVRDDGQGMSPEVTQHLFEPFFTTKERGHGTGLGLATVQSIVKAHGGELSVRSEEGRGSQFEVFLPSVSELRQEVRTPMATAVSRTPGRRTVLVVDDDELQLRTSTRLLGACGHDTLVAHDGREAVEVFVREHGRIDLVLLDLVMPGASGEETCRALREVDPTVKVVFVSGRTLMDASSVREAGGQAFLGKPFDLGALERATALA